ncbi:XRE family transcriptional regulator [Rhodoferax sp.]|uniref:helix-turn-helix domain-containing protein n=1 Tax=Rhodoferax sp. TaxID=50421 RepID=UPI0026068B82|nr:XRE family transcriptional regulator [Rhodoferax sp.]MDD2811017.1 XRE family transcriptional regulator [Rhodoferax sp.]MDD4942252.1 XRE family transcriptional regulator [Rhodoferax sp.]
MSLNILSSNLQRLRHAQGMSQDKLALAAGISRIAYLNIERSQSEPRTETVRALAKALHVRVPELLVEAPVLKRVRFRSLKRLKRREQVLVEVGQKLRDFSELETLLNASDRKDFNELRAVAARAREQGVPAVAAAMRNHFGLREHEPVHDICGLLERQGVKVLSVNIATDAFLGLSVSEDDGGPAVIVNTWERLPVEHWIFSAAHELAHLLLHLQAYQVDEELEDKDQERDADVFASHFLMPEAVFRREWDDTVGLPLFDRVLKVKRVFRVSWRTVLFRINEGMSDPNQRKGLWIHFANAYKKVNSKVLLKMDEPQGVSADAYRDLSDLHKAGPEPAGMDRHDFQGDRLWRLVRIATIGGVITLARGAEILGIKLNEMRDLAESWAN